MKRLIFAIGALALGLAASVPAQADYAVARFPGGHCRVWVDPNVGPWQGELLAFRGHRGWHHRWWGWYYRMPTWQAADHKMHQAVAWHRCRPW